MTGQSPTRSKQERPRPMAAGKRGRPTPERAAEIDAAIRAAALDLFVEVGFEAASMDAIATRANVSKGTLYARYDSKEPLFRAILSNQLEDWGTRSAAADPVQPATLEGRLRRYARTMVTVGSWPEYKKIASLIDTSSHMFPDLRHAWHEQITQRGVNWLTDEMRSLGGPGPDWAFYAKMFISAVAGLPQMASERHVSAEETIAFADKVIGVILIAIRSTQTNLQDKRYGEEEE